MKKISGRTDAKDLNKTGALIILARLSTPNKPFPIGENATSASRKQQNGNERDKTKRPSVKHYQIQGGHSARDYESRIGRKL